MAERLAAVLLLLTAAAPAAAPDGLTARQRAGRTIYRTGESPSGGGITATVGGDPSPVPGSVLPCASCHGEDGLGRPEGGALPSVVTWSELTRPGGHAHPGRPHGPFDARTIARAITDGLDPAGQKLGAVMPRYSMSREDMEALLAYMKVLERQLDPGLAPDRIRLGTVLPEAGPFAEAGRAMGATLRAAVKELNASGGLNGRTVTLEVAGYDPARESGADAARRLVAAGPCFALVGSFVPGSEGALVDWAEAEKTPVVGTFTPLGRPAGVRHWTFLVQPGLPELARVLVEHARSRPGLGDPSVAVLRTEGEGMAEAEAAATRQAEARGWRKVRRLVVGRDGPTAEEVTRLAADGVEVVLLLGEERTLRGLLERSSEAGWAPWVLAPGPAVARAAAAAPPAFDGRLLLAFPGLPAAEGERARARLERLEPKAGDGQRAARTAAAEAAAVLAEALRRTGRQLSRERLVASLEGLYRVETGLGPPVSYGPRRRVGILGGYVVALDQPRRTFRPASDWIRLD